MMSHNDSVLPVADCLFCRILHGDIPAQVVARTHQVLGFQDIQPQAPTHWLFIHRQHTASHGQTEDPQVFADLLAAARDAARDHGLEHYRLIINNGAGAGQSVFHLHLHLLAGRKLQWPPG